MVTLALTYCVVAYLLIPAAVFRLIASLFVPLKTFERTKTQEIVFAVGAALLPFFLTWAFVVSDAWHWPAPVKGSLGQRWPDYMLVFQAISNEKVFGEARSITEFWNAFSRVWRRQLNFLSCYYFWTAIEGVVFGLLVIGYPYRTQRLRDPLSRKLLLDGPFAALMVVYGWLGRKVLLRHLSQWAMFLTPFNFRRHPRREVWVDVLSTEGTLYRGVIGEFFLDTNGALTGFVLEPRAENPSISRKVSVCRSPVRFDRELYKRAKEVRPYSAKSEDYWRIIPSGAFYIPSEKMMNLNISYEEAEPNATSQEATRELIEEGLDYQVELIDDSVAEEKNSPEPTTPE